jgi:hypothetical protein
MIIFMGAVMKMSMGLDVIFVVVGPYMKRPDNRGVQNNQEVIARNVTLG